MAEIHWIFFRFLFGISGLFDYVFVLEIAMFVASVCIEKNEQITIRSWNCVAFISPGWEMKLRICMPFGKEISFARN